MIRAIPTVYKGVTFRSRIEARWAVFFDAMGIRWDYELEGFELESGGKTLRYLPDFWLPDYKMWFEVKGQQPSDLDIEKVYMFSYLCNVKVAIFQGGIRPLTYKVIGHEQVIVNGSFGIRLDSQYIAKWGDYQSYIYVNESSPLEAWDSVSWAIDPETNKIEIASLSIIDNETIYGFVGTNQECVDMTGLSDYVNDGRTLDFMHPSLNKAYMTAQTKKFEFGDKEQW